MSYVIELAWPAVALVFGALVVWRVEGWARGSFSRGLVRRLEETNSRLTDVVRDLNLTTAAGWKLAERVEKLEAALKAPAPAVERHTKEALQRFR